MVCDATKLAPAGASMCPCRREQERKQQATRSEAAQAALSLELSLEADRIITAPIWAHWLVPLPFAFCIMDRL